MLGTPNLGSFKIRILKFYSEINFKFRQILKYSKKNENRNAYEPQSSWLFRCGHQRWRKWGVSRCSKNSKGIRTKDKVFLISHENQVLIIEFCLKSIYFVSKIGFRLKKLILFYQFDYGSIISSSLKSWLFFSKWIRSESFNFVLVIKFCFETFILPRN